MKFISAVALATLGTATAAIATPPSAGTAPAASAAAQQAPGQSVAAEARTSNEASATAEAHKATPKIGDAVFDKAGESVGTIEAVTETTFVLATADGKATMEIGALGHGPKGHMIALTKAELGQAIRNAAAAQG